MKNKFWWRLHTPIVWVCGVIVGLCIAVLAVTFFPRNNNDLQAVCDAYADLPLQSGEELYLASRHVAELAEDTDLKAVTWNFAEAQNPAYGEPDVRMMKASAEEIEDTCD